MRRRLLAIAGAGAVVTSLSVAAVWPGSAAGAGAPRAALLTFERIVDPLVSDGGRVVQQGMKPALGDLLHDHITPPAEVAHEATGWVSSLRRVQDGIDRVDAPAALRAAQQALHRSLDLYVMAAQTFRRAALAPASTRKGVIFRGIAQAQRADTIFDQAAADIQALRRAAGLAPSTYFPDPA